MGGTTTDGTEMTGTTKDGTEMTGTTTDGTETMKTQKRTTKAPVSKKRNNMRTEIFESTCLNILNKTLKSYTCASIPSLILNILFVHREKFN